MAEFLNPTARSWYSECGLPYQREYLLCSPPGTGKSSFSLSVAGHFDLDLYVLSMSGLSNHSLKTLFADLPQHCVVLLEDVDATSLKRTQEKNAYASQSGFPQKSTDGNVSLSTLLNVLDGIGAPEGRVLIMTTDHIERLDPALIRPGRVDMKVEFQLADDDMISQLFFFVYAPKPSVGDHEPEDGVCRLGEEKTVMNCELYLLVRDLVTKVPELEFSPAELMSLLLANKRSPHQAIASVDGWMKKAREERKKTGRTKSWTMTTI